MELVDIYFVIGGWVHSVAFSPSGSKIAWVGHDASISVAVGADSSSVATMKFTHLPLLAVMFLSENTILAAGKYKNVCYSVVSFGKDKQMSYYFIVSSPPF